MRIVCEVGDPIGIFEVGLAFGISGYAHEPRSELGCLKGRIGFMKISHRENCEWCALSEML